MVFEIPASGIGRLSPPSADPMLPAAALSSLAAGPGYRFDSTSLALRACFDGRRGTDWRVLRIGPADAALAADAPVAVEPGRRAALWLRAHDRDLAPVPVEVTDVHRPEGRGLDIAVRLLALPLDAARELYGVLDDLRRRGVARTEPTRTAVVETIGPDRAAAVVRALLANGCGGTLLGADGAQCALRPALLPGGALDLSTPLPLCWDTEGPVPTTPVEIRVQGLNSIYRLAVDDAAFVDGRLATALPSQVLRERRRAVRRTRPGTPLEVAYRHSLLPSLRVERPVRDVSLDGLSFWTRPTDDLLIPGLELDDLVVRRGGHGVARFSAEVRQISQPDPGDGVVGGLRLAPRREQDRRRWAEFIQDLQTPDARTGRTSAAESWDLYDASGYFRLSNTRPEDFEPIRTAFAHATDRLDHAPDLGCQVVYPSPRGVEASISIVKVYTGTYFPGQLARRPGDPAFAVSGRKVLRDIHLRAYEHLQADPDFRWLLVFVHESASWTQMAYRDFPRRYLGTGDVWVEPFVAWVGSAAAAAEAPAAPADGFEVGPATPAEIDRLLGRVRATRGPIYAEALDLVPARVRLGRLARRWGRAGLQRERAILVARRDGEAQAAALFETGEKGIHLFNMFDAVRVYGLSEQTEEDARTALLRAAQPWYAARDRASFTYFLEDGAPEHAAAAGLRPLGGANQLIMSSAILPDFLECIFEVTAPGGRT